MNVLVNLNDVKDDILKKKEEDILLYKFKPNYSSATDVSSMFKNCSNLSTISWQDLFIPNEIGIKLELI